MNEFNIITTYYNNKSLLLNFVDGFNHHKKKHPFLKLYIVDDGSEQYPADSFLSQQPDVHLYRVTEDIGFNSHGCRNLAMQESDKELNLMIDSDVDLRGLDINFLVHLKMEYEVYDLAVNSLLIRKETFFACKGYDEEIHGFHFGDRYLINYFNLTHMYKRLDHKATKMRYLRKGRDVLVSSKVKKTIYDEINRQILCPSDSYMRYLDWDEEIKRRYLFNDFADKKIIQFPWVKVW